MYRHWPGNKVLHVNYIDNKDTIAVAEGSTAPQAMTSGNRETIKRIAYGSWSQE